MDDFIRGMDNLKKFSVCIPKAIFDHLEAEALREDRNRNQMIIRILRDHYGVAPTVNKSKTRASRASPRRRKVKSKTLTQ